MELITIPITTKWVSIIAKKTKKRIVHKALLSRAISYFYDLEKQDLKIKSAKNIIIGEKEIIFESIKLDGFTIKIYASKFKKLITDVLKEQEIFFDWKKNGCNFISLGDKFYDIDFGNCKIMMTLEQYELFASTLACLMDRVEFRTNLANK